MDRQGMDRQMDGQKDGWTERWMNRQGMDRQGMDRHTNKKTGGQIDTCTDEQIEKRTKKQKLKTEAKAHSRTTRGLYHKTYYGRNLRFR